MRDYGYLGSHLVFHASQEDSRQYLKKIAALRLELVFRQVPGQSIQGRWMTRFRALPFRRRCPLLQPVRDGVLRVRTTPRCLRPRPALALAFLRRARPLSLPDPWVRPEPLPTNPAWPFLEPRAHRGHAHRNPPASPPPLPPPIRSRVDYFCRADPDSSSKAPQRKLREFLSRGEKPSVHQGQVMRVGFDRAT